MPLLPAPAAQSQDVGAYFVIDDGVVVPLTDVPSRDRPSALQCLIEQEVNGRPEGPVPARVLDLLAQFGFEWEPATEPGHMRFLPRASTILGQTSRFAEAKTRQAAQRLGVPFDTVDGVNVIDGTAPLLQGYLDLIAQAPSLYGSVPYRLAPPHDRLLLRQTACLEKYAIARTWDAVSLTPRCLYELSDSYRHEPQASLQLCLRLRRFRVPEAHVHAGCLADSLEMALVLHDMAVDELEQCTPDFAILVTASHDFALRRQSFLLRLASRAGRPALLRIAPPGSLCQDGVEVDVEYKLIDTGGVARELTTFQIDELITRSFGLSTDATPVATIHAVLTGSLERYIFSAFDRIAAAESVGRRARLPLWLSPVVVRIVWPPDSAPAPAVVAAICGELEASAVRSDVDDRPLPLADKVGAALDDLVPFQVHLDSGSTPDRIGLRPFEAGAADEVPLAGFLSELTAAEEFSANVVRCTSQRLSRMAVLR